MPRNPQTSFFKPAQKAYGGGLQTRRRGRGARPIATKYHMHLILRSSRAVKEWSFKRNDRIVTEVIVKFARKYGIRVVRLANVGNHLHMQIKIGKRYTYYCFIRAVTASIAVKITKTCRWNRLQGKFWDRRPFTRIVTSLKALLNLRDYVEVNQLEGQGVSRARAYIMVRDFHAGSG